MKENEQLSHTFPKTMDGVRMAVAGLPLDMRVVIDEDVPFKAASVRELKSMQGLPQQVEVIVPFCLRHDSRVCVRLAK